jgi:putative oxidoreductase
VVIFPREGTYKMLNKLIATSPTWFTLPIRLGLAAVMIAHGSQKVLGTFNGSGFKAFIAGNTPFSFMQPPWLWLGAAAFAELLGGLLVALGLLTRVGAFFIACVMLTAIIGVHWTGGFFAANRGYEYPLALLAMAVALMIAGGGQASVDRALSGGRSGGRRR